MRKLSIIFIILLVSIHSIFAISFSDSPQKKIKKKIVVKKEGLKLGVVLSTIPNEKMEKYKIDEGAYVLSVLDGSPADEAGLQKGDIITKIDDTKIENPQDVVNVISDVAEGQSLNITIFRNGDKKELTVKIREFSSNDMVWIPDLEGITMKMRKVIPEIKEKLKTLRITLKGGYLGVEVDNLTDQLKEYFEVENGVLIKKVIKNSPADKAGLKAGDVIMEISGKKIEDYQDLTRVVNYYDPGDKVNVIVMRKGKKKEFKVTLGKKPGMKWIEKNHFKSLENLPEMLDEGIIPNIERELEFNMHNHADHEKEVFLIIL